MSEDEETVCRLTYREGKEIEEETRRPYEKEATQLYFFGFGILIICAVISWALGEFNIGNHATLDSLLANGDITQGFYDYEVKNMNAQVMLLGCCMMFISFMGAVIMASIGKIEGKKALKKANEKKVERCRRSGRRT